MTPNQVLKAALWTLATPFLALTTLLHPHPAQAAPPPPASASPSHLAARPPTDAIWPLHPRPEIVRGFDLPAKPWLPGHRGLDLAGSAGQQVFAPATGTITYSGPLAGRGVIVITHGQLRTTYEPVIPTLPKGTSVTPGTPIAHLSAAGTHCPPHPCLHWGLLKADTYLNPLTLLPTSPVRLLPHTPPGAGQPARDTKAPAFAPTQPEPATRLPALTQAQPTPPHRAQPPPDPAQEAPQAQADPNHTGELAAAAVVSLAAAATAGGSLLIRRH